MDFFFALTLALAVQHADAAEDGPARTSELDAINCRLDVPHYMQFALALDGEEKLARKRRWKAVVSRNAFIKEYELPAAITVAGAYRTRRIGFTGNAILAILDLPDPATIARAERIDNAMSADPMIAALAATGTMTRPQAEAALPFRKFMGERILTDVTEPAGAEDGYGSHFVVARTISNATTHPGKTFYGCSYRLELLDKDGTAL